MRRHSRGHRFPRLAAGHLARKRSRRWCISLPFDEISDQSRYPVAITRTPRTAVHSLAPSRVANREPTGSNCAEVVSMTNPPNIPTSWNESGGGGIRTHGTFRLAGFQVRRLRSRGVPPRAVECAAARGYGVRHPLASPLFAARPRALMGKWMGRFDVG
jgi:hypothetical protein